MHTAWCKDHKILPVLEEKRLGANYLPRLFIKNYWLEVLTFMVHNLELLSVDLLLAASWWFSNSWLHETSGICSSMWRVLFFKITLMCTNMYFYYSNYRSFSSEDAKLQFGAVHTVFSACIVLKCLNLKDLK